MTAARRRPVLYVIACGGRPAADLPAFITWAQDQGWDACVITTPAGTQFVDAPRLASLTGHPVRDDYKRPEDPDVLPFPPDAFVVAPATFNTINKWANGISDTLALGLLNEGLPPGSRSPRCPTRTSRWPSTPHSSAASRSCARTAFASCSTRTLTRSRPLISARRAGTCSPGRR